MTAMLRTEKNMQRCLDFLSENPSYAACARAIGAADGSKVLFRWIDGAENDRKAGVPPEESKYACRWPLDEDFDCGPWIYFSEGVLEARKKFSVLADGEARSLLGPNAGARSYVVEGGRVQPSPDFVVWHDSLTLSDEAWTEKYGDRPRSDIWARRVNAKGETEIVPLERVEPINSQRLIHVLRSILPGIYNPVSQTQAEVTHRGGVLVLGAQKHEQQKQPSPLETDLRAKLAHIRANGPSNKQTHPIENLSRGDSGPKENVSMPSMEQPATLDDHPGAYQQPASHPPRQPATDYARRPPTRNLNAEDRPGGKMPSGGFDSRGRPT